MVKEHKVNAAALFATAFAFMLACCFLLIPSAQAYALDVVKCTARTNAEGSNDVLGATETRITWEGQSAPEEQVTGLSLTFPEGSSFSTDDARVTMLSGEDLMTRTSIEANFTIDGQTLHAVFAEPAEAGGYLRLEVYEVFFPAEGGDMVLTGSYTVADGSEIAMSAIPAISVKGVTAVEQLTTWLENQEWVQAWNSNKFLKLFFNPPLLVKSFPVVFNGFLMALAIVAVAFPLAIPFGLLLALMRMARLRVFRGIATTYVNVVRGTPLFLQIYIAFFGLPLAGIQIPPFPLGVIVLAMNSSAYLCEIFRAGIQSISKGQFEASRSLGMNGAQTMLFVIIPQTVRRVIPTMTSEFILLYKDTSLLAAVGVMEVVMYAKSIVASTGSITPYIVAACFYLVITLPLAKLVGKLESKLAGNDAGASGKKKKRRRNKAAAKVTAAGVAGADASGAKNATSERGEFGKATGFLSPLDAEADALRRPDAVDGDFITPEKMSSL